MGVVRCARGTLPLAMRRAMQVSKAASTASSEKTARDAIATRADNKWSPGLARAEYSAAHPWP